MNATLPQGSPPARKDAARLALLLALVALVVAAAHGPALSARAISFDDDQYFVSNGLVRNPGWYSAKRFLTEVLEPSTIGGYYQPLNMISLMLDAALGATPDNLLPLHRTSLLLHIANTLLLILLLRQLFENTLAAAAVGLLFGLHPMTVETIPWTGERKTLLATFFALLSLMAYVRYARARRPAPVSPPATPTASGSPWYIACLVLFILALMAKPTVTPLPLLLLFMDAWPLHRLSLRALLEKIPFVLVAGVSSIITFISQARTAAVSMPGENPPLYVPYMLCHNNIFYLRKMLYPAGLSSHYAMPQPFDVSDPSVLAGVIGTLILLPLLLLSLKWTRACCAAWLFYFFGLLPTMQIVGFSNVVASDKYAYFPCVGLLFLLTAALARLASRPGPRATTSSLVAVALLVCAVLEFRATRNYLAQWRDTETLYRHMISLAPRAHSIRSHLGNVLLDAGRIDEALAEHAKAVELAPRSHESLNDLGNALRAAGRAADAIKAYTTALEIFPDYHVSHRNLGVALADIGNLADAERHFARAVELKPRNPEGHDCWAVVLMQQGRTDEAIRHLNIALELNPGFADANNHLGVILASQRRTAEALDRFRRAVAAKPDYLEARYNLARALFDLDNLDEARQQLNDLLKLAPADAESLKLLEQIAARRAAKS